MEEIWKDINGFEGKYQISNLGRVKSLARYIGKGKGYLKPENFPVIKYDKYGYPIVCLACANRIRKTITVHKLVGLHFLKEKKVAGYHICHKDGNKHNNKVSNLYIGNQITNTLDKYRHKHTKISITDVSNIRKHLADGKLMQREIADLYGVRQSYISRIKSNVRCSFI